MVKRAISAVAVSATTFLALATAPSAVAVGPSEALLPTISHLSDEARRCPTGYVCLFRDIGHAGGGYGVREGSQLNDFRGIDHNDQMSSWINATSRNYCWYPDINFSGTGHVMLSGYAAAALLPEHNDTASSLKDC